MTWAELYALQNWIVNGVPIPTERDPNAKDLSMSWNVKPTQMLDMAFIHDDRLISSTRSSLFLWSDLASKFIEPVIVVVPSISMTLLCNVVTGACPRPLV